MKNKEVLEYQKTCDLLKISDKSQSNKNNSKKLDDLNALNKLKTWSRYSEHEKEIINSFFLNKFRNLQYLQPLKCSWNFIKFRYSTKNLKNLDIMKSLNSRKDIKKLEDTHYLKGLDILKSLKQEKGLN